MKTHLFCLSVILWIDIAAYAGEANIVATPSANLDSDFKRVVIIGKDQSVDLECITTNVQTGSVTGRKWYIEGGAFQFIEGNEYTNPTKVAFLEEGKIYKVKVGVEHEADEVICSSKSDAIEGTLIYIKVAKVEVDEVSFGGTGNYRILNINGLHATATGNPILVPEWESTATVQKHVLYKKSTKPVLSVKYKITPDLLNLSKSVKVKAIGAAAGEVLQIEPISTTITQAQKVVSDQTTKQNLNNKVQEDSLNMEWSISFDGGTAYNYIANPISVPFLSVYDEPGGVKSLTRLKKLCGIANNKSSIGDIAEVIGPECTKFQRFDPDFSILPGVNQLGSCWEVFDNQDADCYTLSTLMKESLELLGLREETLGTGNGPKVRMIYACHNDWSHLIGTTVTAFEYHSDGRRLGFYCEGWNNWEATCYFNSLFFPGGKDVAYSSARNVLNYWTLPNNDITKNRQVYRNHINDDYSTSNFVPYPEGNP